MAKWDSDGLLIQTKSVEKVLAPLVAQVSYCIWFCCLKYLPMFQSLQIFFLKKIRSNHWSCFVRKSVLRNFTKFTRKHLSKSIFFLIKLQTRPATLF